jgi:hypothetical protein
LGYNYVFSIGQGIDQMGKCQKNMIEGTTKRKPKKDVCHFPIVLKIMFQKWFPLEGAKPQKKKKTSRTAT